MSQGYPSSPPSQVMTQPHGYPFSLPSADTPQTFIFSSSPISQGTSQPHVYPSSTSQSITPDLYVYPHLSPLQTEQQHAPPTHGHPPSLPQVTALHTNHLLASSSPLGPESTFTQNPPPAGALSSGQQPTPKPLSIEDTGLVYQNLYPLRAKWKTLGTFLHIDHDTLQVVKEDNESSDDRLSALVALWLKRITPPATWQALYEAVQYIDPNQAEQIRKGSGGIVNLARSV